MENLGRAFTLLLAGFVIVFVVLVLLIIIITLYGKIIQAAQRNADKKKQLPKPSVDPSVTKKAVTDPAPEQDSEEIPGEIIAVIAAAVDAVYGSKPHHIKKVKRSGRMRSAWGNAGLAENTRPF